MTSAGRGIWLGRRDTRGVLDNCALIWSSIGLLRRTGNEMTELASAEVLITVGVDTRTDLHVAAALDQLVGSSIGTGSVPTTAAG